MNPVMVCQFCGVEYTPPGHHRARAEKQRFCSRRCSNRSRNPRWVHGEGRPPCIVEGCVNTSAAGDLCGGHVYRLKTWGDVRADVPLRKKAPPGTRREQNGYLFLYRPGYPGAAPNGCIAEHRVVMTEALGRPLTRDESVHHKNGDRQDNRLENLELRVRYHGNGQSVDDRVADAIRTLERYAPERLVRDYAPFEDARELA